MQLAAKGESVAMTDTEKCRVRELMDDVDTLFEHSDKEEVIEQVGDCNRRIKYVGKLIHQKWSRWVTLIQ